MERMYKKVVHCVSNGDLDNLKKLYRTEKRYFSSSLLSYAIRNNRHNIINYLINELGFTFQGVNVHYLIGKNGGRSKCSFETIQYLIDVCGVDEPIKLYQRCISIAVYNRKFRMAYDYSKRCMYKYPDSLDYLLKCIDLEYPNHRAKPTELIELYRDLIIVDILT